MRIIKNLSAMIIYLLITTVLLDFNFIELFHIKEILLSLAGTIILYLPAQKKEMKQKIQFQTLGECALYAGILQTFILVFVMLSKAKGFEGILYQTGLCLRPALYGLILKFLFAEAIGEKKNDVGEKLVNYHEYFGSIGLTNRETEIAVLICNGLTNKEIAAELFISEATVKKHISNIFAKLGITKREELREKAQKG